MNPERAAPARVKPAPTCVKRLFILLCGFEILPKTVSTRGLGGRFILSEPVCAYLLDTESGWVLLDAGLNPANGRDPVRIEQKFRSQGFTPPVIRDGHLLEKQFADIGVTFADVGHVILSHLHYDHCGYLSHFTHARISIQRREHEYAFRENQGMAYFRDEYDDPRLKWDLREGDWEAMPGLRLIDTRGHTEGHQSAVVELPRDGTLVLPFDAGDLAENFDAEILPGETCDDEAALRALRRIKTLAAQPNAQCLLFHDPVAIQTLRLCPDFYS
jgi:N-acyl homoserine lactone hydrolase